MEIDDRALSVWAGAVMQRASLIDNASGEEIHQDHIHLMHEADNHAWKCHGLSLWSCGQAKLSSPSCHSVQYLRSQGHSDSPRHRSCPVPDKRIKNSWDVFMTMADSVLFGYSGLPAASSTVHSTLLHTHRHTVSVGPLDRAFRWKHKPSIEWLPNMLLQRKDWHFCLFVVHLTFENITD